MPSTLSANHIYEVRVRSTLVSSNQEFNQIYNWGYLTVPTGAAPSKNTADALTAFVTAFRAAFLPVVTNEYAVQRYELRSITGSEIVIGATPPRNKLTYHDLILQAGTVADVGTRVGALDYLPPYASVSFEQRLDIAGRGFFGVHRPGPVLELDQTDGSLTPAGVTAWTNALSFRSGRISLAVGPPAELLTPVLFRKTQFLRIDPLTSPFPATFASEIQSNNVATRLGTQMSRKQPIRRFGY